MLNVEASRSINAPPERVWDIITDLGRLSSNGLGITRIEGVIGHGKRLKLWSEVSPGRPFLLKVGVFDPPHRMVWQGGMPLNLFRGRRTFTLRPDEGGTHLAVSEAFDGPLAPLITRSMPDLKPSFEQFVSGVKRLAEGDHA